MRTGTIETPYGSCNRDQLSTGCKTVLNTIYLYRHQDKFKNKKAIYATECGANALEVLFRFLEEYKLDIGVVLEHHEDLMTCGEREYLIDNKRKVNSLAFYWAHRD